MLKFIVVILGRCCVVVWKVLFLMLLFLRWCVFLEWGKNLYYVLILVVWWLMCRECLIDVEWSVVIGWLWKSWVSLVFVDIVRVMVLLLVCNCVEIVRSCFCFVVGWFFFVVVCVSRFVLSVVIIGMLMFVVIFSFVVCV